MNDHDQSNAGTPQLDSNSASGDEITLRVRTVRPPTTTPVSTPELASEKEQGGLATPIPPNPEREAEEQSAPLSTDSKEKQSSAVSPPVSPPRSTSDLRRSPGWRKKRVVVVGAVVSMIVLLGAGGFYAWRLLKADQNVTVYQVGVQNATQDVGGAGIVFPLQQVDISYPVVERAIAVFVKAGDQVSPKQPLIQLDTAQLNAELVKAADDLAAASVYLNSVSATGNPVTIAQAQQAYDFAKNKYEALVAETSSPLLQNGALIAPMKGVVTAVNIDAGEVIAANTTLITIMDESSVIVHAEVPLSNLGQVHLGQQATVTPSALPNLNFPGKVTAIIPQANSQTDTFEVWVEVNNPNKMLLPGMSAFVRLQSQVQALVVPRLAVLNPDRESVVFIVRNQRAYMQHVHVVGRSINALYIDRGLSAGDEVVLVGVYKLQTGQKVLVTDVEDKIS